MKKIVVMAAAAVAFLAPVSVFAAKAKKVTIEFWTHEDANRQKLEDRYIKEFTATHPNVTVNVTRQSSKVD